ncbi:MAG: hypothetical protein QW101_01800 [Ignisphaera sp.]|uniref:Uncharacterized protein n=1 Tax=Ignisphaera aggregans TaxID=334771 RepID=A0A7J3MZA0_9CREN
MNYNSVYIRTLLEKSFKKVYVIEEGARCILFLALHNNAQYLITVINGDYSIYSKVVPADLLIETYWNCNYVLYTPQGLYAFAKNVEELINKIIAIVMKYDKAYHHSTSLHSEQTG